MAGPMVHGALCLARLDDGTSLLVDGALPDERVDVELQHRKGRVWFAHTVAVHAPSAHRVEAPCPYYGVCGGCQLQHVEYAHQLELKADIVRDAMRRQSVPLPSRFVVHGANDPWRYRWRGEFHVIPGEAGMTDARLGFNRLRSWRPVAVDDCLIHHPRITASLPALTALVRDAGGDGLTALHLTAGEGGEELLLRPRPARAIPAGAVDEHAQMAGQRWSTTGTTLSWRGHDYRVSSDTFVQVNWGSLELLYGAALRGLGEVNGRTVVDAYAGVGVLACELAAQGASVVCIESNRDSARLGVLNTELNDCALQVRYVARAVEDVLATAGAGADAVLLDPPRAGCDPRVTAWLALAGPANVVYVSCDPATLARDLRVLCVSGPYRIEAYELVDMFPQTHHIESVVTLRRDALEGVLGVIVIRVVVEWLRGRSVVPAVHVADVEQALPRGLAGRAAPAHQDVGQRDAQHDDADVVAALRKDLELEVQHGAGEPVEPGEDDRDDPRVDSGGEPVAVASGDAEERPSRRDAVGLRCTAGGAVGHQPERHQQAAAEGEVEELRLDGGEDMLGRNPGHETDAGHQRDPAEDGRDVGLHEGAHRHLGGARAQGRVHADPGDDPGHRDVPDVGARHPSRRPVVRLGRPQPDGHLAQPPGPHLASPAVATQRPADQRQAGDRVEDEGVEAA